MFRMDKTFKVLFFYWFQFLSWSGVVQKFWVWSAEEQVSPTGKPFFRRIPQRAKSSDNIGRGKNHFTFICLIISIFPSWFERCQEDFPKEIFPNVEKMSDFLRYYFAEFFPNLWDVNMNVYIFTTYVCMRTFP